jgi:crotonobetainyl-CoA:carnitine CoA-transferase CaiB-like acyl-CoA transferase
MSAQPFEDVRILDFTHCLAGPFATFQLALQGADVIKVEPRGGDGMRIGPVSKEWSERGMGPASMAVNAGKRSITLDVTRPEGADIVRGLATRVDVVVENFRPGVMERLGIGFTQLSAVNPQLIYCGISGFGATGPKAGSPSFDGKIQAMSGLMSLTGEPEQGPMRAGFAAADISSGMMAAFAIASALYQRTHTSRGQFVDVAMLDSMLNFLGGLVAETTVAGYRHTQFGNRSVSRKPTADRFRCSHGFIVLAVLTEKQFTALMTVLGRPDVLRDPRFGDWYTRTEHAAELRAVIETAFGDGEPKELEARLSAASVPCATVYRLEEIIEHPQVAHRGLLQPVETPHGPVKLVGTAIHLAHGQGGINRPVARPGEHNDEVLAMIGYDASGVAELRERHII